MIVDTNLPQKSETKLGGEYNIESVINDDGTQTLNITTAKSSESLNLPNADMIWVKQVCIDDIQEGFERKIIQMFYDDTPVTAIQCPVSGAIKTSDGAYYTYANIKYKFNHTWDDTNAKASECYDGKKIRWAIFYLPINSSNHANISHSCVYAYFEKGTMYAQSAKGLIFAECDNETVGYASSFYQCNNLITFQAPDTSALNSISSIINGCYSLKEFPLIDTSNVTNMRSVFSSHWALKTIPLLNTSKVTSMEEMFSYCMNLETIPQFDTSNVTSMRKMFNYCYSFKSVPLLNTSKVTNMEYMFYYNYPLRHVPLFDTSNVTNMSNMFYFCRSLEEVPLFDTSKVTNMVYMFSGCSSLRTIPQFDTSNVTNMYGTFNQCFALKTVPKLDTRKVTNMYEMFYQCANLITVEGIDMINCTNASNMFSQTYNLTNLNLSNIRISLLIGTGDATSASSTGALLTLDSLLNTFKELWDMSAEESSMTLTIGSANLEKIKNVYVKLITPTEEMIANDPYIESKMPCEVCESTDEGAMLLTDYATLKKWTIA